MSAVPLQGRWYGRRIVLVSDTVEVFEDENGVPKAIFTASPSTELFPDSPRWGEIAVEETEEHYGRKVSKGMWTGFKSEDFPHLPEPSFDPPFYVCELDGWAPELEE